MSSWMKRAGAIAIVAIMLTAGTVVAAEDMEMKDMEMMDMSKAYDGVNTMKKKDEEYVQLRQLATNLGYMIGWDAKTKTVTLAKDKKMIKLMIGSMTITVDGMDQETMYAPLLSKGRTYVSKSFADQYILMMMQ